MYNLIEMEIEQMKILLEHKGNLWAWEEIEKYNDINKRFKYRQIFFLAGGGSLFNSMGKFYFGKNKERINYV